MIAAGADVNAKTLHHSTALMAAVNVKNIACVNMLIDAGADVNIKNKSGYGVLHLAIMNRLGKCVRSLLDAGADVNVGDTNKHSNNITPVMKAVLYDSRECLNVLLEAGADINSYNSAGLGLLTALSLAVETRNAPLVNLLIKAGADVNEYRLETPLMKSVRCSTIAITRMLTKAGADVNTQDYHGFTALMEVGTLRMKCAIEHIQLLLLEGASVNIFNSRNRNALLYHTKYHRNFCKSNEDDFCAICLLLFAAGESTDGAPSGPACLPLPTDINLKHLCREAMRKHLLKLDSHSHLFGRVPRLGLPTSLTYYLVYDVTLDEDDDDGEEEETSLGFG